MVDVSHLMRDGGLVFYSTLTICIYMYGLEGPPLGLSSAFLAPPFFAPPFWFSIFRSFSSDSFAPPSPLVTVPHTEPVVFVLVGSWHLYKHIPDSAHNMAVPLSVYRRVAAKCEPRHGAIHELVLIYMYAVPYSQRPVAEA